MSERIIDKIRNGTFDRGRRAPTGWVCRCDDPAAAWRFDVPASGAGPRTVRLQTHSDDAIVALSQRFRCRTSQWYRIDVAIAEAARRSTSPGRLTLNVEISDASGACIDTRVRPGPGVCDGPLIWRELIHTPADAHAVSLTIAWGAGAGHARIARVRCIPIDEPAVETHPLAVPPPARSYPPPRRVERVAVVGETAPAALMSVLHSQYGAKSVAHVARAPAKLETLRADGVIFTDARLPRAVGSLKTLLAFAADRIVIISPQQFVQIAASQPADRPAVRMIRQRAEPIGVKVREANFVTRGFALLDVFGYARYAEAAGEYTLAALPGSRTLRVLLEAGGFVTTLVTEGATDPTTDLPACLVRPTARGAVVVLDLSPFDSDASTDDGDNLASLLVLNALGRSSSAAGQYVAPQTDRTRFAMDLDNFCHRFPALQAIYDAASQEAGRPPRVRVAPATESYGLPARRGALLRIRTRFTDRDWLGCYSALLWLKTLLRPTPWTAPHLGLLLERYEMDWRPASGATAGHAAPDEDDETPALLLDIIMGRTASARVIVPDDDRPYHRRLQDTLPALAGSLLPDAPTLRRPADGGEPADRPSYGWHTRWPAIDVVRSDALLGRNHDVVRIELPAVQDAVANSVWMTELAIFLMEATVGLHAGLLAVNRSAEPRTIAVPQWAQDAERVVLTHGDGVVTAETGATQTPVALPPGACLFAAMPPAAAPQREPVLHFVRSKVAG